MTVERILVAVNAGGVAMNVKEVYYRRMSRSNTAISNSLTRGIGVWTCTVSARQTPAHPPDCF